MSDTTAASSDGRITVKSDGAMSRRASSHATCTTESGSTVTHQVNGAQFVFEPAQVTVEREVASDWLVQSAGSWVAALDPVLTDELRMEGLAREVVNRVQRLRKEAGYEYTTRIALWLDGAGAVLDAVRAHGAVIRGETLARVLCEESA